MRVASEAAVAGIPDLIAEWSRRHPALSRTDGRRDRDRSTRRTRSVADRTEGRGLSQVAAAAPPAPAGSGMQARRLALLALFEEEFRPAQALAALERLAVEKGARRRSGSMRAQIVEGVLDQRAELDAEIARHGAGDPGQRARERGADDPAERAL